jgi:hypothetical protein
MKGKTNFSDFEKSSLRVIIKKYENSTSQSERKSLRVKMRNIGFYMSNYGISNITSSDFNKLFSKNTSIKNLTPKKVVEVDKPNNKISEFKKFDPLINNPLSIPDNKGNYLILLKEKSQLPKTKIEFTCKTFKRKKVIYTGISNKSLRNRDFRQHFNGTAGNSTLRKSIGSMFGWKKIPRDKVDNGKTKFSLKDETELSKWMKTNLELHYFQNSNPEQNEQILIDEFNPPLNLSKNKNIINSEFRNELSQLRKMK